MMLMFWSSRLTWLVGMPAKGLFGAMLVLLMAEYPALGLALVWVTPISGCFARRFLEDAVACLPERGANLTNLFRMLEIRPSRKSAMRRHKWTSSTTLVRKAWTVASRS